MRRFLTILSILFLAVLTGNMASAQDDMRSLMLEGERYMREGNYSRAKWLLQLSISQMDVDSYDDNKEYYEHLLNDCTECQIYLDECARAYLAFYYKVPYETPREELRHLHLECLFWQRPIMIRTIGKERAQARNIECVEKAAEMLNRYRRTFSKAEIRQMEIDIMNDRIEVYHDTKDKAKIKALLSQYASLAKSVPDTDRNWPWLYYELMADALQQEDKVAEAMEIYDRVLAFCLKHNIEKAYIPCLRMSDVYVANYASDKAHEVVGRTAAAIRSKSLEQYRQMTAEERYTAWGNSTSVKAYKVLPQVLPEGFYEDILYDAALYSKNVLMDIDLEEAATVWKGFDMDYFQTFRLRQLFAGTDNSLLAEWEFKDAMERRNPVWSKMEYSWKEVRNNLRKNDVAVEIIRTGGSFQDYSAVLVRSGWDKPRCVRLCTQSELDAIGMDADTYRGKNARIGYDLLVKPIEQYLNPGDNIFFSPEGSVNALNVGAFVDPAGKCAAEKYGLYRVSTTRRLSRDNRPAKYDELLLFGDMDYYCDMTEIKAYSDFQRAHTPLMWFDEMKTYPLENLSFGENTDGTRAGLRPLEYTREEIDNIGRLCSPGIEVKKYTGWMANEECFKKTASPVRLNNTVIYHIATHSFSCEEDPTLAAHRFSAEEIAFKRSGLMFSGAGHTVNGEKLPEGVNDGMLYAEEIAALDMLNTDMVVLSACNTALGEYSLNGVLGLQRAFKKAGCKTIVMTLWKVNDKATSMFMTTFYENLFSGASKHDAFTKAQMAVRKEYDDPYYWAPFIMLD